MRYFIKCMLAVFLISLLPLSSYAWNILGHKVIAQIAYDRLNPKAKSQVDTLIATFHKEYPKINSLIDVAPWPDEIRAQKIETFTHWHYIDIAFSNDNTPLKNLMDTDNAVWAITNITPVVKNPKANEFERARFLAFLTHITGDLHQPLHTVSLISATHPDGDKGGNDFFIRYQNDRMNLHHLWDEGVGSLDKNTSNDHVKSLATSIVTAYPEHSFATKATDLLPKDWAIESMELAQLFTYDTQENEAVNSKYIRTGQEITNKQIALAGYRLAGLLNQLLGE